jgi:transposase
MTSKSKIRKKYLRICSRLDEKSRRLWCATEALAIEKGGVAMVHAATGIARSTIYVGINELTRKRGRPKKRRRQKKSDERIRKTGGGAKTLVNKTPEILEALEALIETDTKGNPQNPMRWTSKSLRKLSEQLKKQGYDVSHSTIATMLKQAGYSLQLNRKDKEGKSVPDRNAQFQFINDQAKAFLDTGEPVISVDTKKKELIGEYKNAGRVYRKQGDPIKVNVHDFPDKEEGKVAPYGVYDIGKNKGWVGVGITNDTAEFAVNTIRSWWRNMGKKDYPKATKLMITADCGGSNGNRVRLWKVELQKLANEFDLEIHICHFPPGTSKWNKIEHKMFSYISQNWRGVPLITQEAVVQLIGSTTTTKGLQIQAQIDYREYSKGKKVTDEDLEKIAILRNAFHGEWNYIISPVIVCEIE